jgi:hypothetical protein
MPSILCANHIFKHGDINLNFLLYMTYLMHVSFSWCLGLPGYLSFESVNLLLSCSISFWKNHQYISFPLSGALYEEYPWTLLKKDHFSMLCGFAFCSFFNSHGPFVGEVQS